MKLDRSKRASWHGCVTRASPEMGTARLEVCEFSFLDKCGKEIERMEHLSP
jgi:hypothetical protein